MIVKVVLFVSVVAPYVAKLLAYDIYGVPGNTLSVNANELLNAVNWTGLPTLVTDEDLIEYGIGINIAFNKCQKDCRQPIKSLVRKNGYRFEHYKVETEDGYILTLFRIPGNGTTVFLMHQLLGSADDFVLTGPNRALAYLLADDGFDVWLGNARGNKHSREHKRLIPSNSAFWDFSFHEIGYYDLPAMIDYILETTRKKKLMYIGHSQGASAFIVMAAERPEYNCKVSMTVFLAPLAFMKKSQSPIVKLFAENSELLNGVSRLFGAYEFLPAENLISTRLSRVMCGPGRLATRLCSNKLMLFSGFNLKQIHIKSLPMIYSHTPAGASMKQFIHYAQLGTSEEFKYFDYGAMGNLARYGKSEPPGYDLFEVDSPIIIFYSEADWLAHPEDVANLQRKLRNVVEAYKLDEQYNHVDFLWGKDFKTVIYDKLKHWVV